MLKYGGEEMAGGECERAISDGISPKPSMYIFFDKSNLDNKFLEEPARNPYQKLGSGNSKIQLNHPKLFLKYGGEQ